MQRLHSARALLPMGSEARLGQRSSLPVALPRCRHGFCARIGDLAVRMAVRIAPRSPAGASRRTRVMEKTNPRSCRGVSEQGPSAPSRMLIAEAESTTRVVSSNEETRPDGTFLVTAAPSQFPPSQDERRTKSPRAACCMYLARRCRNLIGPCRGPANPPVSVAYEQSAPHATACMRNPSHCFAAVCTASSPDSTPSEPAGTACQPERLNHLPAM
jgi:hypothetical protein